jgi:hypothetical protein
MPSQVAGDRFLCKRCTSRLTEVTLVSLEDPGDHVNWISDHFRSSIWLIYFNFSDSAVNGGFVVFS